jgi:hypothetical protein
MANLSYEAALQVLKVIDKYTAADFDALGITESDFEIASGNAPWRRDQLIRVMRTLNALVYGSLEVLALPKIRVPSEYVAAIVASFVHPSNRMIACTWLAMEKQTGAGAMDMSSRNTTQEIEHASAEQLFSLVIALSDTEASTDARKSFRKRLGLAVEEARRTVQ